MRDTGSADFRERKQLTKSHAQDQIENTLNPITHHLEFFHLQQ